MRVHRARLNVRRRIADRQQNPRLKSARNREFLLDLRCIKPADTGCSESQFLRFHHQMRHKDTHIQRRGIKIVERIDPGVRRILTQNQNDGSVKGRRRDSSDLFQRRLTAKRINLKRLDIFGRRSPSARLDNRVVRFFFYRSVLKLADGKTFFASVRKSIVTLPPILQLLKW